jgi:hypothetical protein
LSIDDASDVADVARALASLDSIASRPIIPSSWLPAWGADTIADDC